MMGRLHWIPASDSLFGADSQREKWNGIRIGTVWRSPAQKRGSFLHRRLIEIGQRGIAVRSLGGCRAGEMRLTRFLRNSKVTVGEIVEEAAMRTQARVAGRHVLAVQDTTSLRENSDGRSLKSHPVIAVDAETGSVLGLVHASFFANEGGKRNARKERGFALKASRRWLDGAEAAAGLREAGALCVTVVADRESDIYEMFALKPAPVELLIRAAQDRALEEGGRLFAHLASQPVTGQISLDLPAAPGRAARTIEIALRFCRARIKRPGNRNSDCDLPESVAVNLIEAREINPPEGEEGALWRLITSHEVESFEDARYLTGLYRRRWQIEELFRTLKTRGFDIERVTIAEGPFEKLAAAALVAAVSVLQLVQERDGRAKRPLEDVFHADERQALEAASKSLEGKTERQKNPHPKGSLAYAAWVCARLGGWTGYYGNPGPIVMLRGLHQFRAIQHGWTLAQNV